MSNDIFEECLDDVDLFMEKHEQNRLLTKNEVLAVYALGKALEKFDSEDVLLGFGRSSCCPCIFKIEDESWIVWETDERRGFYCAQAFSDVKDACLYAIELGNENQSLIDKCREHFMTLLDQDMSLDKVKKIAKGFNYSLIDAKVKTKSYNNS